MNLYIRGVKPYLEKVSEGAGFHSNPVEATLLFALMKSFVVLQCVLDHCLVVPPN